MPHQQNEKILRAKEVRAKLGIARSTLYDWLNEKSPRYDASFPGQIKLGLSSVGWLESEINQWIDSRKAVSRRSQTPTSQR